MPIIAKRQPLHRPSICNTDVTILLIITIVHVASYCTYISLRMRIYIELLNRISK